MSQVSVSATEGQERKASFGYESWSLDALLNDGARAWRISRGTMLLILMVPALVLMAGVVSGLMGKATYKLFTGEDKIAENIQVLLWSISFVLCFRISKMLKVHGEHVVSSMYMALTVGLFFIIGEELSWGQRFFGWSTPELMREVNKQSETNIHNIHGIGTTFKWLQLIVGAYGTILPILLFRSNILQRFNSRFRFKFDLSWVVPHYTLVPFFVVPFVWRIYRNLFEAPKEYYFAISEFSEVVELVLAFGFMFFMLFQFRRLRFEMADQ